MLKAIAMPPKYGTGSFWVLRSILGKSIAPNLIAKALTGPVRRPLRAKAATPKMTNCIVVILTGLSIWGALSL
jgi:hypothetical protein